MKRTLLIVSTIILSFSAVIAQEEGVEKLLTTNVSQDIEPGSVACSPEEGPGISENHYFKEFNLTNLGVEAEFHIESFQFGVESVQIPEDPEVHLAVDLYKTNETNFPVTWGSQDYEKIASEIVALTTDDEGTIFTLEFESPITVEPNNSIIAHIYHGDYTMKAFYIGSNTAGDTVPSYLMAPGACDIIVPTPVSELADERNFVMNIQGTEGFLGVEDFADADLTLYPNPASDQFNITSGNEVIQSVIVRDILGKTIETIEVNGLNQDVNVSNLPKGLYLVEVELETGRAVQKLIKK